MHWIAKVKSATLQKPSYFNVFKILGAYLKAFLLALPVFFLYLCIIGMKKGEIEMLSKEKLARINELSKLAKEGKLTEELAKERTALRKEYLDTFRSTMRDTIEHMKVIDEEGNDVTPEKLKQIKSQKNFLN